MHTTRRRFLTAMAATRFTPAAPVSGLRGPTGPADADVRRAYATLDEALRRPVFTRDLFPNPLVIASVELLRYRESFLCRVRSKEGAEGLSVGNSGQLDVLYPIFTDRLAPFFIGKDARDRLRFGLRGRAA